MPPYSEINKKMKNLLLTFFHRYGGTIYAFLFSSDIVNNLSVAVLSKSIVEEYGYKGLFLIISAWGVVALLASLMYPRNPSPVRKKSQGDKPVKQKEVFPTNSKGEI